MVQWELSIQGQWHAVRRYDTAHGFAHCDILHPDGRVEKVPLAFRDFNDALTFAETDVRAHWSLAVQRYAQEVKRDE